MGYFSIIISSRLSEKHRTSCSAICPRDQKTRVVNCKFFSVNFPTVDGKLTLNYWEFLPHIFNQTTTHDYFVVIVTLVVHEPTLHRYTISVYCIEFPMFRFPTDPLPVNQG